MFYAKKCHFIFFLMSNSIHQTDFTPEEESGIKFIFDQIDNDKSGEIDEQELKEFLDNIFKEENQNDKFPKELWPLVSFLCGLTKVEDGQIKTQNSEINFQNFKLFFDIVRKLDNDPKTAFKVLFDKIDLDGNKTLELDEFELFSKLLALDLEKHDIEALFHSMDENNSGHLSFNQVVSILGFS